MKYNSELTLHANLIELMEVPFGEEALFHMFVTYRKSVRENTANMATESEELYGTFNGLKELFELPESAGLTELSEAIDTVIYERNLYRDKPDTTQPQLTEERYVLHCDIQPCTVLYSDDTTTLLRLPEGDMMCETETIEWSDSVTYRCQELLKSATSVHIAVPVKTSKLLAQLVRDERILLNDNGDDELPRPAAVIPAPKPTCNNQYKHVSTLCEQDLRNAGWTTEELVQNGCGHYVPVSRGEEQPCEECDHVFDAQSMTCPMCMTIRSSEWTDNNSPTPLR